MSISKRVWIGAIACLLVEGGACAKPLPITYFTRIACPSSNVVQIGWSSPAARCIVAQASNLATGKFEYVGPVLAANEIVLTNQAAALCFRIREVAVVDFPDANLRRVATNAIVTWQEPRSELYDVDFEGVTELDCSGASISNAAGLGTLGDLVEFWGGFNQLTDLNLTGCTNLTDVSCAFNQLTNLVLTGLGRLSSLYCHNNRLTSLDLSDCPHLAELSCWGNLLTNLNLAGFGSLNYLDCYGNQLTNLDLTGCTNLTYLDYGRNHVTNLDARAFPGLVSLDCYGNGLTSLSVAGLAALDSLGCGGNQLTNLDLSGCISLTELSCWGNPLSMLDMSCCGRLTDVLCRNAALTNVNLSGCTNLYSLDFRNNRLADLSALVDNASQGGLGAGDEVWLSGNPLSALGSNQLAILTNTYHVTVYY